MVCQWGLKVLLYRKASTRQRTSQLRKRLQNFHESTAQMHQEQSRSLALPVKLDFKNSSTKGNSFVCGIPGHTVEDCRRKETAQCSESGGRGNLDRARRRQRDGSKHEPVAMGPTLASPDEEYWAALTQWKTVGLLIDRGLTDQIVTNIDAFLDFVTIQSVVRNPIGEASRLVGRSCVRISIPSNKGKLRCELKNVFYVPDYSSNLVSVSSCTEWGHSLVFEKRKSCMRLQKGTREKLLQENNLFYSRWQCREVAQTIGPFESSGCGRECTRVSGGNRWCMQCVRIGKDHKESSTKSGRDPSRSEASEGVHRRDETFQSTVSVRVLVLHCVCRPVHEICLCGHS